MTEIGRPGLLGKDGFIEFRLLYLDLGGGRQLPIRGRYRQAGENGNAILSGGTAKLVSGALMTGFISGDLSFAPDALAEGWGEAIARMAKCRRDAVARFAKSGEVAQTVVDASMGECASLEHAVKRQIIGKFYGSGMDYTGAEKEAEAILSEDRRSWRAEGLALVLKLRGS